MFISLNCPKLLLCLSATIGKKNKNTTTQHKKENSPHSYFNIFFLIISRMTQKISVLLFVKKNLIYLKLSVLSLFLQLCLYEVASAHAVTLNLDMLFLLMEVCKSDHYLSLLLYSKLSQCLVLKALLFITLQSSLSNTLK